MSSTEQASSELFGSAEPESEQVSLGHQLDKFAESSKSCMALATKARSALNTLTEDARLGKTSSTRNQVGRASRLVNELAIALAELADEEQTLRVSGSRSGIANYVSEVCAALASRGVEAVRGPEPYWLVYPASFKIEPSSNGGVEVVLNGRRLDTVRPTLVADEIKASVDDKFDAKKFREALEKIRLLLRRLGATTRSALLDDVYELYKANGGRRAEFTKSDFYYAVHRLAETVEDRSDAQIYFPPSDRSENFLFFTRHGDGRRYLTIEFREVSTQ
jgi:hypothetical protein